MTTETTIISRIPRTACFILVCGVLLLTLIGCTKENVDYKAEADDEVYGIIDDKWQEEFGSKVNYRISDVTPDALDIQIDKVVPQSSKLTLAEAVTIATANNRQYQLEKENLYNRMLELTLVRHQFESNGFGGVSGGYGVDGSDGAFAGSVNRGFSRLLADGTRISTNVAIGWAELATGDVKTGLSAIFSGVITKPLLRGSQRKFVMEGLTQAERNGLYQIRAFNRFRKEFVVSVITQYYRILESQNKVNNARDNHTKLTKLYEQMKVRMQLGRFEQYELNQAQQDVLQARDKYVRVQNEYLALMDQFKIFLALPSTVNIELNDNLLQGLSQAQLPGVYFNEKEAIEAAIEQRLDLSNKEDFIADAQRKVEFTKDRIRAELNVVAGGDGASSDISGFETVDGLNNSSRVALNMNDVDSSGIIGMELDLPFDRKAEKVAYRKALITLSRTKRDFEEATDTIVLQVRQAYRDMAEAASIYQVQVNGRKLAKKRFDNTVLLLQYDRANTRDILDSQEDYFEAQDEAAAALVDYMVAMLNFYRDAGVLNVKPDGMWTTAKNVSTKEQMPEPEIIDRAAVPAYETSSEDRELMDILGKNSTGTEVVEEKENRPHPNGSKFIDQWMQRRQKISPEKQQ